MYSFSRFSWCLPLLFFIINSNIVTAQESGFIYGKLVHTDDQTPIPFAHITIKNKAKGTISNMDGGFRIPDGYYQAGDTLMISSIGYYSKEIPLLSLKENIRNIIFLARKEEILDEIALETSKNQGRRAGQNIDPSTGSIKNRISAKDIVQFALDRIPENYPFKPFSYVGYYRDYQINKGNYLNLNEAVLQVFDGGFGSIDSIGTDTRIYKYHNNQTFPTDTLANMPYDFDNERKYVSSTELGTPEAGRNEYTLLRIHDALRNYRINTYDFVNRLDTDFIENHKFRFLPITYMDSIPLYTISIHKRYARYFTAIGQIFISKGDYKIYKLQYAVYDKSGRSTTRKEQDTSTIEATKKEKKLGKLLYEIIVEYQLHQGIMYPNYISFNNSFQSLKPPVIFPKNVEQGDLGGLIDAESMILTFSLNESQKKDIENGNYRLWYNNKRLKYHKRLNYIEDEIFNISISKTDIVVFHLNKANLIKITPYKMTEKLDQNNPKRDFNKIYDDNSYELYIGPYRSLNQYREFFVQELEISAKKPIDSLYMRWDQPFENQPIAPKENLLEYWINTPLKN